MRKVKEGVRRCSRLHANAIHSIHELCWGLVLPAINHGAHPPVATLETCSPVSEYRSVRRFHLNIGYLRRKVCRQTVASSVFPRSRAAKPNCSRNGQTSHVRYSYQQSQISWFISKMDTPSSPMRCNAPFLLRMVSPRFTTSLESRTPRSR